MQRFLDGKQLADRISGWLRRPTRGTGFMDIPEIPASIGTTIGEVRSENQDRAVIVRFSDADEQERSFLLTVVCDGMGGMLDGGRCAEIAIATLVGRLVENRGPITEPSILSAVSDANAAVFNAYQGRGGTTLAAVLLLGNKKGWGVSVGDSRLSAFAKSGKVRKISVDDTIAGELRRLRGTDTDTGQLEEFSKRLAQFIGLGEGLQPRVYGIEVGNGEDYLLSTDGVHMMGEVAFDQVVSSSASLYAATTRLVQISRWCGGRDNASVICVGSDLNPLSSNWSGQRGVILEVWDSFAKLELFALQAVSVETAGVPPFQKLPGSESVVGERVSQPGGQAQSGKARSSKGKRQKKMAPKEKKATAPNDLAKVPSYKSQLEMEIVESAPEDNPQQKAKTSSNRP